MNELELQYIGKNGLEMMDWIDFLPIWKFWSTTAFTAIISQYPMSFSPPFTSHFPLPFPPPPLPVVFSSSLLFLLPSCHLDVPFFPSNPPPFSLLPSYLS